MAGEYSPSLWQLGHPTMFRWREQGWRSGMTPIHHHHSISSKNACDIALVVDAMQLCEEGVRFFVLASFESDYVPLVRRLRERGCVVVGMGRTQTLLAFKQVCTHFMELGGSIAVGNQSHRSSQGWLLHTKASTGPDGFSLIGASTPVCLSRRCHTESRKWISLSAFTRCLLSGMDGPEQMDREGLAQLLENLPGN